MNKLRIVIAGISLVFMLCASGCGQKGPLYLPDPSASLEDADREVDAD